jgi:hypothetical protein
VKKINVKIIFGVCKITGTKISYLQVFLYHVYNMHKAESKCDQEDFALSQNVQCFPRIRKNGTTADIPHIPFNLYNVRSGGKSGKY